MRERSKMNKIAIYYIATNQYIVFLDGFLEGLSNFFPDIPKKVVVITDCETIDFSKKSTDNIEVINKHIDHYYWPIPTLFKMFYIDKFFADDCDYHFYCNANMKFIKTFEIKEDFDMTFMVHYLSNQLSLYRINNGNCNNCVVPPVWAKCHISKEEIPNGAKYCQGGFFGGKTDKVSSLLNDINDMLKEDLKHNIIPIWHDETYLNKFLIQNYWQLNIIGKVRIVDIYSYAEFMKKDDYFDKFNI